MKVSRNWLQKYFEKPLPDAEAIAEAFTFHSFEVEGVEGDILDVKVLPNRAADCLSHRGIAKDLSAILDIPLKYDPLRQPVPGFTKTDKLEVIVDAEVVSRHTAALVRGVKVGPSPKWLQEALESVGQRSITNVVDITNYLTLDLGQPMHAFDAGKISWSGDVLKINIRRTKGKEKVAILTGEELDLPEGTLVIADGTSGTPLDVAGIKGGLASGIDETTKDLFVSVGNYDGTLIRKTSQALHLVTDASLRFQNRPSPELTAYCMRDALKLFEEVTGGKTEGVVDVYPKKPARTTVAITPAKVSELIGITYSDDEVADVLKRLDLPFEKKGDEFVVTPPFERTDITIPEDLVEEVGRIIGYDKVPATELPPSTGTPDQSRYHGIERMKDMLVEEGFTEVSTQSFAKKGDVYLANPLDKTMPALRKSLEENLKAALEKAKQYAPLLLPPSEKPKLFEVGTVFEKEGEHIELRMTERVPAWGDKAGVSDNLSVAKLEDYGKDYEPKRYVLAPYKPFSAYPFALRDIAVWVPSGTDVGLTMSHIVEKAGLLLKRCDLFDTFEKDGRVSYAFRLVFESAEKTLTDEEVNAVMQDITDALNAIPGWQVR